MSQVEIHTYIRRSHDNSLHVKRNTLQYAKCVSVVAAKMLHTIVLDTYNLPPYTNLYHHKENSDEMYAG